MKSLLVSAMLAAAALAGGCSKTESDAQAKADDGLQKMTVDEVDKAIADNTATAVDCNGDKTRKKMGVLPGAILVSDEDSFAASEMPADKARRLVFYCANSG